MKLALSISGTPINAPGGVPTGGIDVGSKIIQIGFGLFFLGGIILTIAIFIYSGIQWILSGGDKQMIEAARKRLIYAVVGLILIIGAFAIVEIVLTLLGYFPSFFGF